MQIIRNWSKLWGILLVITFGLVVLLTHIVLFFMFAESAL